MKRILYYTNWFLATCSAIIALGMLANSLKKYIPFNIEIWHFVIVLIVGLFFAINAYFLIEDKKENKKE